MIYGSQWTNGDESEVKYLSWVCWNRRRNVGVRGGTKTDYDSASRRLFTFFSKVHSEAIRAPKTSLVAHTVLSNTFSTVFTRATPLQVISSHRLPAAMPWPSLVWWPHKLMLCRASPPLYDCWTWAIFGCNTFRLYIQVMVINQLLCQYFSELHYREGA